MSIADDMLAFLIGAVTGAALVAGRRREGSAAFRDEGQVGSHWGSAGSGILWFTYVSGTGPFVLLLHRSSSVNEPHTWGIPGGAVPVDDETGEPMDSYLSAMSENAEETGTPVGEMATSRWPEAEHVYRDENSGFQFTTYLHQARRPFEPKLNWESDDHRWVSLREAKALPLHPGLARALPVLENKLAEVANPHWDQ